MECGWEKDEATPLPARRSLAGAGIIPPSGTPASSRRRDACRYVEGPAGAPFARQFQARFHQVGGHYFHAAQGKQPCEHESDGPLPCHQNGVAGQQVEFVDAFEDGVYRFLHGAFHEGVSTGNFDDTGQDKGHDADVFGVTPACRLKARSDAGKVLVLRTLSEGPMATSMAFHAGNMVMQGDAFADAESANARANAHDGSGGFMAENAGWRGGAVMNFFDVGWADAACRHLDEQFIGTDARDGQSLEAQIVHAAINHRAHGFGNIGRHKEIKIIGKLATKKHKTKGSEKVIWSGK